MCLDPAISRSYPLTKVDARGEPSNLGKTFVIGVTPTYALWTVCMFDTKIDSRDLEDQNGEFIDRHHLVATKIKWLGVAGLQNARYPLDTVIDKAE